MNYIDFPKKRGSYITPFPNNSGVLGDGKSKQFPKIKIGKNKNEEFVKNDIKNCKDNSSIVSCQKKYNN